MIGAGVVPCSAELALERVRRLVGAGGQYILGTGDYRPRTSAGADILDLARRGRGNVEQLLAAPGMVDLPWTTRDGEEGSDCVLVIVYGYMLRRHRPGFNRATVGATVADDLNCNSAIEDGQNARELFEVITRPELGCLLVYPTVYVDGEPYSGHVEIVSGVSRCLEWDAAHPDYSRLDVYACRGPNHRRPGVIAGTGAGFNRRDVLWPKPAHRTVMLRVRS